jgi:ribose/xylose/arabinose/galactoside ABC-type transport system permease subunit
MDDAAIKLDSKKSGNFKSIVSRIFRNGGVYIALLILIILSGILSPKTLEPSHILDILKNSSVLGIVAIAQTLLILTRGIDLSVGAHVIFIMLLVDGISMGNPSKSFLVIVVALVVGILVGLLNGILVVKLKIEPLVGSLGVMSLITGISFIYTKGFGKGVSPPFVSTLGSGQVFGFLPVAVIIWAVISIVCIIMLKKTVFGRYIYTVGSNPKSASIVGINVSRVSLLVYVISGLLVAIAGIVWAGYLSNPTLSGGETFPLDSIAAVIIGGTTFAGGKGGIGGSIVGALIIGILASLLNIMGLGYFWKLILQGVIILLLVFSYTGRSRTN